MKKVFHPYIRAGSIADDARFKDLAMAWSCAVFGPNDKAVFPTWNAMVAYIDARQPVAAPEAVKGKASDAERDVLAERQRQLTVEGWTPERDDGYTNCELARAAATYAVCSHVEQLQICGERAWPWHIDWFKRTTYRRDLVKAGALILAEIERLDRDAARAQQQGQGDAQ